LAPRGVGGAPAAAALNWAAIAARALPSLLFVAVIFFVFRWLGGFFLNNVVNRFSVVDCLWQLLRGRTKKTTGISEQRD
jgi:hypothetical protein